jgi:hypothetical protein
MFLNGPRSPPGRRGRDGSERALRDTTERERDDYYVRLIGIIRAKHA